LLTGALLCALATAGSLTTAASAYTAEPQPWMFCGTERVAAEGVIEHNRRPADASQATAGGPVTFSSTTRLPLAFTISSSPNLTPPLDGGFGADGPNELVTFTSSVAGATPGTVYWTISFTTAALPACAGLEAQTLTLATRTLNVLAPPAAEAIPTQFPVSPPTPPGQSGSPRRCQVPYLRGTSLARARMLLKRGNCRLGKVTRRRSRSANGVVTAQSPRAGVQRPAGTVVAVTIGLRAQRPS